MVREAREVKGLAAMHSMDWVQQGPNLRGPASPDIVDVVGWLAGQW